MDAVAIKLDQISKSFAHQVKGQVYAAKNVSLDVEPGEFVTLLGPSGCGKTTTLRMIAGFGIPDTGRILIGGDDVTHTAVSARNIGFVFQNYALFPHLSIFENVAYGLRVRGQSEDAIRHAVGEVLQMVGLGGYEQQFSSQLSGGEQQRVALARAIVIRPRVLLFDEPLSNLDARLRVQMRDEIRALQKRLSITTVYVTHDQEEAMAVSDRIAVMSQGSIVQVGSAEDLYYRPASEFVARFVGKVNLVPGRIDSDNNGMHVVALGRRMRVRHAPVGVRNGDDVQVVLRPEVIAIASSAVSAASVERNVDRAVDSPRDPQTRQQVEDGACADDAPGAVDSAIVRSRTFLGEKVELLVECGGELLQIARHSVGDDEPALAPGLRVRLQLPREGVPVIAKASA